MPVQSLRVLEQLAQICLEDTCSEAAYPGLQRLRVFCMKQFVVQLPAERQEPLHTGQLMDSLEDQNSVVPEGYMNHMFVQEHWGDFVNIETAVVEGNAMNRVDYMGAEKFHMTAAMSTTAAVSHNFAEDQIAQGTGTADTPA